MQGITKLLYVTPFLIIHFLVSAQNNSLIKNFLTVDNGLSHNEVTSIVQDNQGFIWIGTRGGLNRYDGYDFKIFNQVPGDTNSLVNPSIQSLFVDSKGNIWIGTKSGGVSKYNPVTGIFTNFISNYNKQNKLIPGNRILCFHEGSNGMILVGTWENGLVIYNEEKKSSKHFPETGKTNSIIQTDEGKIWIGSDNGLWEYDETEITLKRHFQGLCGEIVYDKQQNAIWIVHINADEFKKFDLRNNTLTQFHFEESKKSKKQSKPFKSILVDQENKLWVGTWGMGLYTFSHLNKNLERYMIYPDNQGTINKDYDAILDIFQDKDGNIWLGTNGGGLCVLSPKLNFKSAGYHPEKYKGLPNSRIMSVLEDRNNNLWLGTIGSGLMWSPDKENFYQVKYPDAIHESRYFVVKNLFEDNRGNIWAGTGPGIFLVDFNAGKPRMIRRTPNPLNQGFDRQIVSFLDAEGMLWFGSLQNGLFLTDKELNFKIYKNINTSDPRSGDLHCNRFSYLLKDSKNRIWAGTYNGLHIYNPKDTTMNLVNNYLHIEGEFTGNIITCLNEDKKGNLWIGTPNGLNKLSELNNQSFKVEYFTEKDGLASNFIKGISHDLNGNIWLSTNVGISKLVAKEEKIRFVNFNESDGVNGKNFTEASVYRNENSGEIFFGGTHGLTWFNPDEIEEQSWVSKPVFTGLSVLNKTINPGQNQGNEILSKSISHTDEIELSYRQDKFEIQFSALDFKSSGKNRYKIFLENYDKTWNDIGYRRFAIYNNLKPGEYLLKVKSSNRHNKWNEEASMLRIIVKPPFWQTWYALIFYILLVVGIVTIISWNAVKQVKLANSLEMEKLQHKQDQRLNEMKLRFFTNLSHEFRTPLTLILAPLKELVKNKEHYQLNNEAQNKIGIVQNNSLRLMKLVNQLIDFRKVESGNMKLFTSETNLGEFVAEVCHPFFELAKINNIKFKLTKNLQTQNIWVDRDKLEIILNNLISNAFKSVKENDKIEIATFEEEDEILLSVSDSGPGIPPTEINHIFDRFYRIGKTNGHGSSGIGLALTKRFVELHKGSITVVSKPNENTEFTVSLPKGTHHLKRDEMVNTKTKQKVSDRAEQLFSSVLPTKLKNESRSENCILIVEDNKDVNDYLYSLLEPLYCTLRAYDGVEGYKKTIDKKPDLIISDVMMPNVDGFEFCKKIKTNESTSTIPFIFLTAKSDEQFRLLGTQLGADDFLSKPFDPNLLLQKVKNTLESRKKLQKQYSKSIRLEPSDIEITSSDEVFVEKAILVIEENLMNSKFTSNVLATEMNMSSSSLYRKLKGLTNASTAEFIRSIRIKRAAQLLADKDRTVSEIAFDVGFNDVKHFRTVFQKQFNCSPSEYREKLLIKPQPKTL